MATYIKGADTYLPEITPFTPDFKFLSAVLDTRTDKYDANFQATNDLYNKVVYADLSRQDTKDRRDQYAETIAPQIQQISGLDLSLQQNVDQAKSVFAPFYDDDLTVKDIVYTKKYRDEMAYANRLLDNPDQVQREKYWETGIRKMQYEMDDFINGSESAALSAQLPKYIEDADLNELAQQILSEMDPPLKMKMDRFATDEDGNVQTDFIITEQNGRLVTGAALNIIKNRLLDDPRVQRAYYADAFVKSRDFAAAGMNAGQFNTVDQGQQAWADETISRINALNEQRTQETIKEVKKLDDANVRWSNYQANNGVVPGSDEAEAIEEQLSVAEQTQQALDDMLNINQEARTPSKSVQGSLNKAYNLLMNYNIMDDMQKAATDFAARDQEYTIRENRFALAEKEFKYDLALERARAANALNLEALKQKNRLDLAAAKGELMQVDPLASLLTKPGVEIGDGSSTVVAVDEDGEISPNTDMVLLNQQQFQNEDNKIHNNQVNGILESLQILDPKGNTPAQDQTYQLKGSDGNVLMIGGVPLEGNIETLRNLLTQANTNEEDGSVISYINREIVDQVYDIQASRVKDSKQVTMNDPNVTLSEDQRTQYDDLYNAFFGLNGIETQRNTLAVHAEKINDLTLQAYELMESEALGESKGKNNINILTQAGFPRIVDENGSVLSKEEYTNLVIQGVENGTIENPDLYGWDTGTSSKDYKVHAYTTQYYEFGAQKNYKYDSQGRPVMEIDRSAVANDVDAIYDQMYTMLNQARTGAKGDIPTATFNSLRYGADQNPSDAISMPTYTYPINPLAGLDPNARAEMVNLFNQLNTFDKKGQVYGILPGDLDNVDVEDLLTKNPLAVRALELYKEDLATYLNDPKQSRTDKIAPIATLKYKPVYGPAGEAVKTTAGYQIIFSPEWLASKKAGTADAPVGAFTSTEIRQLQGLDDESETSAGISIVFEQRLDNNTKGTNNSYYSFVESDILASENGFADYTIPDGLVNTAEYRIIKAGTGDYKINYTVNRYVPYDPNAAQGTTGIYVPETATAPVDFSLGLPGVDRQVKDLQSYFEGIRNSNRLAKKKDTEQYGER